MDNATLEPQRGGVCSAFPFMLSDRMVELPITLPMDHTLINVLRRDVVPAFASKLEWIRAPARAGGLPVPPRLQHEPSTRLDRYGAVITGLQRGARRLVRAARARSPTGGSDGAARAS